jgi:hypothetical protein
MTSADVFRCVALRSRKWFALGSIHVGFVVDEVTLGQISFRVLRFSPINISFHRRSPNSYHLENA